MAKYIHKFETQAQFESAYTNNYTEPWLSCVVENASTRYNKTWEEKLPGIPLTFKIISAGTINWVANSTTRAKTIEYSMDSGITWSAITSNTGASAPSISVNAGDIVQFRGDNAAYGGYFGGGYYYSTFSGSTAKFEVYGNAMSLVDSTGYTTVTSFSDSYIFFFLFYSCDGLISAENLVLPVTNLRQACYGYMFYKCKNLTIAPTILPATKLSYQCYEYMFSGCTSLTTTPELPATTLADYCYLGMFNSCTSLTTAPELPAITLAASCYKSMFADCTSLITAPELPATTLASMCYETMFSGCISLTTAPELPATTLATNCYGYMFIGCTNLNRIKCLATDISAANCTYNWVSGVSATGTFIKASDADWSSKTGTNGIPNGWTVENAS